MAIDRNLRIYPLKLKTPTQYSLNAGITSAFDYAGDPSSGFAGGDGAPHAGTHALTKDAGANFPTVLAAPGIYGRDISQNKSGAVQAYRGMDLSRLGIGDNGPFTLHHRYRAPSAFTTTSVRAIARYSNASGVKITLSTVESADGYVCFFWIFGEHTSFPVVSARTAENLRVPFGSIVDLYMVRDGTTVSVYVNDVLAVAGTSNSLNTGGGPWTGASSGTYHGYAGSSTSDLILIDDTVWNRALSQAEVIQHRRDPYAGYDNMAVVAPGIKITGPVPNATVNSEGFLVSGTYSGSTPTSIQARFKGGTWVTLVASPSGGSFSGTMPATTPSTGLLEVRYSNNTSLVDSITVTTAPPRPSVSVATQDPPDGQNVSLSIAFQRARTLVVDLVAKGDGAVSRSLTVTPSYSVNAATVPAQFEAVAPGKYDVVVTATNESGDVTANGTPFSIMGVAGGGSGPGTAPNAVAPGAPSNVTATAGNGIVRVSFTEPASNGGAEITGYRVTASTGQVATGQASPIPLNAPNGASLTVTVAAENVVGFGPESAPSNQVTPAPGVPGAPRNVSASALNGAILVSFLPPLSDGGSPVIEYRVTTSDGETASSSSSPIVVEAGDGTVVTATVVAINANGPGPASLPSQPVTPGSAPDAPTDVTVQARNGYALVFFTAPVNDGGWPVNSFRVTASSGQTAEGKDSPVRINLPRDVAATVTVVAINEVGASEPSEPSESFTPRAPFVRFRLTQFVGGVKVPIPNLAGLRYAWFDQPTLDLIGAPTDKGATETTDANGEILIPLPNSSLWVGDIGRLDVSDDTGNPAINHKAFSGPVVVE
jgi:hypothetical protein